MVEGCSDHLINQIWLASYLYPSIVACSELRILEKLGEGLGTPKQLSVALGLNQRSVEILLHLLVSQKFVNKTVDGSFSFTTQGSTYLAPQSSCSWGGMFAREAKNPIVQQIVAAAKTAKQSDLGLSFLLTNSWKGQSLSESDARSITESMNAENAATAKIQAECLDLSKTKKLLDIGGGSGVFSIAFAEKNPQIEATVADLEPVTKAARCYIEKSPARARVKTFSIDFFSEPWPKGFDAILLSNILHDWDQSTIQFLLQKACEALPPGGVVIINEMLTDKTEDKIGFEPHAFSVVMLIRTVGRQMSFEELSAALVSAGFGEPARVSSPSIFSLLVAKKV